MRRILFLLGLMFLNTCSAGIGQHSRSFSMLRFTEQNGLFASDIYGMAQGKDGYIWIGTNAGLFRFDGSNFEHYGMSEGIHSRLITRIHSMPDSSMVLVGERPPRLYRLKKNEITHLENIGNFPVKGSYSIANPKNGNLYLVNLMDNRVEHYAPNAPYSTYPLTIKRPEKIAFFNNRLLLINKTPGYYILNGTKTEHRSIDVSPLEKVIVMTADDKHHLWAIGEKHLFRKNYDDSWTIEMRHALTANYAGIDHVTCDGHGRLWITGSNKGLFIYDPQSHEIRQIDRELDIENVQITYLFRDKDNNMWISTAGRGLLCILNDAFPKYTILDSLNANYITALHKTPDNILWVGTNSGLNKIKLNQDGIPDIIESPIQRGYVIDIENLPDSGIVYTASASEIQSRFTEVSKSIWLLTRIRIIQPMDSNRYAIGGWPQFYLSRFDRQSNRGFVVHKEFDVKGLITECLIINNKNYLLTTSRLYEFDENKIVSVLNNNDQLSEHMDFSSMITGPDASVWIGSSQGVIHYKNLKFKKITRENGLPSNLCTSLALDTQGALWIGTDKGLSRYDGHDIRNFNIGSGLASERITALLFDRENNCMWIGTPNGLSQFFISNLNKLKNKSFPLYIKSLEVIGDTMIKDPVNTELAQSQNQIRIHFAGINYSHPNQVEYQYRMMPGQNVWETTKKNMAEFLALAPDNYQFSVRSRISGTSWGPVTSINFSIAPPFWQQWYFWMYIAMFFALLIWFLARWRIKVIRAQELQKRHTLSAINQLEQQALQASMNPHFIFNSLNSIQHFMGKFKDPRAIDYVAEFATLIRQNMEAARKKSIDIATEIDRIERYLLLENMRFDGKLSHRIHVDESISPELCEIPSMLIQPFVENAIWHGIAPSQKAGMIRIDFSLHQSDLLMITIEDNGVGLNYGNRSNDERHISRGIQLAKERIELHSAHNSLTLTELVEDDGQISGTRVCLLLNVEMGVYD